MAKCKHCKSLLPLGPLTLFCPECGESITDVEKELISRKYAGKKRLNMNLQMLFLFIPLLAFIAAFRASKLQRFVLKYILAFILSWLVMGMVLGIFKATGISFVLWFTMISLLTSFILVRTIRKWTIEWNNIFELHSLIHGTPEV